jgi:hypothetical protein
LFASWTGRVGYVVCGLIILMVTARLSRRGLDESLQRPIERGFGPPCTLWRVWRQFLGLLWERVLLGCTVISCVVRVSLGRWTLIDAALAGVVIAIFPFLEYSIHRYLLHRWTRVWPGSNIDSIAALVHKVHHRDPWHMERAANPPFAVVGYAVGLPVVWFPFLAPPQAMTGIACSWLVFLCYEWIHLLIHTSYVPRSWLFKRIWRNHRLHHFKNEHYWFNVSTYGVDALLKTDPSPKAVLTSATCLTLDEAEAALRHE